MFNFILRIVLVLLSVALVGELMTWLQVDTVYPIIATLFASIFFFFRDYLTGAGFAVNTHMITSSTPEFLWRWLAYAGWCSAVVVMFVDVMR